MQELIFKAFMTVDLTKLKYIIMLLLVSVACNKKEAEKPLLVETLPYIFKGDSIRLFGCITSLPEETVTEFGFLMDPGSGVLNYSEADFIFSLEQDPRADTFYYPLLNNIDKDTTYHIRFYARTASKLAYGNKLDLQGNGPIAPKINGFTPSSGYDGEIVRISGNYFSFENLYKVMLGENELQVIEVADEYLLVKIPDYTSREELAFTIYQNGYIVESSENFLLQGPYITGFTPDIGNNAASITLFGEGFSETPHHNIVMLGTQKAEVLEAAEGQLKISLYLCSLPAGNYSFFITSEGKSSISEGKFEVNSPWVFDSQLPIDDGLAYSTVLVNGNKLYLMTGTTDWVNSAGYSSYVFEYDTQTHLWEQKSDFPGDRRRCAAGFVVDGKGYLGTGYGYSVYGGLSDFWEYNFELDQWTQKGDFPGGPRAWLMSFSYNGEGYFMMGLGETDFWKYNHNDDTWEEMPAFAGHKRQAADYTIIGDELFILGGVDPNDPFEPDIWKFSFSSLQWSFVSSLDISPMKVICTQNHTYILEASTNHPFGIDEVNLYEYDVEQNQMIEHLDIFPGPVRYRNSFSVAIDGILYFGCGGTGGNGDCLNDIWTYPLN